MYDVIIIGGGPAGGWASQKAKESGLEPLLIEKRYLGGVCLNEGCIPSKALLNCAKRYRHALDSASYGVTADNVRFDLKQAMVRKEKIVGAIRRGTEGTKKKLKIPMLFEEAMVLPSENGVFKVKTASGVHEGKRLLICTGSEAIRPPIPGADQPFVMTNREILAIDHVPDKLVIIGGGVIGLEFATFFSEVGSKVTVIEMLPTIAGALDDDCRKILKQSLERKGVEFKLEAKVTGIGDKNVTYQTNAGVSETLSADTVLLSVGRRPNTVGLGFENLHLLMERGAIVTDEQMRTNIPNVWAAGDVNGKSMLAHTASREAEVAISDMAGERNRVRYETIPGVIYTHPEVASVGLTLPQAQAKGFDAVENVMQLTYNGRYLAETENERGIIKAVVDRKLGTVLGVHMIGGECSEMIHGAVIMIEAELRVKDVADLVFAHPTVAEIIKDAISELKM
jgi:dihydrolipoamide dehydrogenase